MTYDPIDTNDDGVVDANVDNQSVHTESVAIGPNAEQTLEYDSELGSLVVIE